MSDRFNKTDTRLDRIDDLVDAVLSGSDLYRVETRIKGGYQPMVDIFVDGDEGINIDQCASISRSLFASIELESIFENGFKLDVSSPGLGQPLRLPRQYKRHVGRTLEVLVAGSESGDLTSVSGRLVQTAPSGITIADGEEHLEFRFEEIERAVVTPSF
ncbi:MAG: ribosome maturation factor RimP [Rhodothermia bacterium]